jgi:hypothetical protein
MYTSLVQRNAIGETSAPVQAPAFSVEFPPLKAVQVSKVNWPAALMAAGVLGVMFVALHKKMGWANTSGHIGPQDYLSNGRKLQRFVAQCSNCSQRMSALSRSKHLYKSPGGYFTMMDCPRCDKPCRMKKVRDIGIDGKRHECHHKCIAATSEECECACRGLNHGCSWSVDPEKPWESGCSPEALRAARRTAAMFWKMKWPI